jgi:uncharacterized membrane protein
MISKRYAACSLALVAFMIAAGLIGLTIDGRTGVPLRAAGLPNDVTSPTTAFLTLPIIAAVAWLVLALAPRLDPRRAALARSQTAYGVIWLTITLVLAVTQAGLMATAAGAALPVPRLMTVLVAGLLILAGNMLGKLRPNHVMGIRTPWTLSHDRVWDQTHRFAGFVLVATGLGLAGLALVAGNAAALLWVSGAVPVLALGLCIAQSYRLSRRTAV